jgi:hypothetical protein
MFHIFPNILSDCSIDFEGGVPSSKVCRVHLKERGMKIHIFDANDAVTVNRPSGWYWCVFRPNRYEIKTIRGPYPTVDPCVKSATTACPSANLGSGTLSPVFVRGGKMK